MECRKPACRHLLHPPSGKRAGSLGEDGGGEVNSNILLLFFDIRSLPPDCKSGGAEGYKSGGAQKTPVYTDINCSN